MRNCPPGKDSLEGRLVRAKDQNVVSTTISDSLDLITQPVASFHEIDVYVAAHFLAECFLRVAFARFTVDGNHLQPEILGILNGQMPQTT